MRMSDEKAKQKEIVKCLVEKETIPKNQVDLQLLRSNFERSPSRSDQRLRGHPSFSGTSTILSPPAGTGEDVVDQSQPSMAEVLVKFRRLERSRRPGTETGRRHRTSSAEGYDRRRYSDELQGSGSHRRSVELEESEEQETTTPQIRDLVALFSKMEGKKSSRKRETAQNRLSGPPRGISPQKDREPDQRGHASDGEGETETPDEGTVQALLLQWKALEKPLGKKRKSWVEIQFSRQAEQKKKTPETGQKSKGICNKTTVTTKHNGVTSQKNAAAGKGVTGASLNAKVSFPKATMSPQKTQAGAPSQKTIVTPQKTHADSHKPDIRNGLDKTPIQSTKNNLSQQNSMERGTTGGIHESPGNDRDEEDYQVSLDGIAKSMTEKFRELERRNTSTDEVDFMLRRKQYRWEVRSLPILGRPQGLPGSTGPALVSYHIAPATPPSSPEPGHVSDSLRQPDVVGNSNATSAGWKSELEEFPLQSQTKNLRAKFEAMPLLSQD